MHYLIMFTLALLISSLGFRKYSWFTSIGYGFSVAAIGVAMILFFRRYMSGIMLLICILFVLYGCRLGGYLLFRELKLTAYSEAMKGELKTDALLKDKLIVWLSCSLLYTFQVSPVLFRLSNGGTTDALTVIGAVIMMAGLVLESTSDVQKTMSKMKAPDRFVDRGLFRIVRCPNYLGEILFWTGVFVSGITALRGAVQWICAIVGYVCIVYIMLGGARVLELRQNRKYGEDPAYQKYVKSVPILLPFVPLYSFADYTFLLG